MKAKRAIKLFTVLLVGAALVALGSSSYIVDPNDQVIVTQFGDPVGDPITEPGLYFKVPFIQSTNFFERRYLEWNGDANEVPTKDKRFIQVDTYARWRIVDPLTFYQRLRDERSAQSRLDDIIDGETRDAVASHNLLEIVRSTNRKPTVDPDIPAEDRAILEDIDVGRSKIMEQIRARADKQTADLGITILDVRFKRINYNDQVRTRVYERMIAERKRIAARYRSEGQGEAARIRGSKEKELDQIQSEAEREAKTTRGEADGKATNIYATTYEKDPDFYEFLRTLETYPNVFDEKTTLVLSTDGEFFEHLETHGQ